VSRLANTSMDKAYKSGVSIHACPFEALLYEHEQYILHRPTERKVSHYFTKVFVYTFCTVSFTWTEVTWAGR